jgi:hypothetical protein
MPCCSQGIAIVRLDQTQDTGIQRCDTCKALESDAEAVARVNELISPDRVKVLKLSLEFAAAMYLEQRDFNETGDQVMIRQSREILDHAAKLGLVVWENETPKVRL